MKGWICDGFGPRERGPLRPLNVRSALTAWWPRPRGG